MDVASSRPAKLIGPLTGGSGRPFGSPGKSAAEHGYVVEEFLLDGVASSYRPRAGTELGDDGRWDVEAAELAEYRIRFYVVRPSDPATFNGVLVVNWQNVTAGFDIGAPPPEIYRGSAWVGASTQLVSLTGLAPGENGFGGSKGLLDTDPERYGSLRHPGDAYSWTSTVRWWPLSARRGRSSRSTRSAGCARSWSSAPAARSRRCGWVPTSTWT